MQRVCSICIRPDKEAIDQALIEGEPYRGIAKRFGASPSSVLRHKAHLPKTLVKAAEVKEVAHADDLVSRIKELNTEALEILSKAKEANDLRTALLAIEKAARCLEVEAKMVGEIDESPKVAILVSPEWLALRSRILQALHDFPEARLRLAEVLAND